MELAVIGIVFFLLLILVAARFSISKQKSENTPDNETVIHTSGIYSIVRKSPWEDIANVKPSEKEIRKYIDEQSVNIDRNSLSESKKDAILARWNENLKESLSEIEKGDDEDVEFYYYDFKGKDSICKKIFNKGHIITRQDIFENPELIPPFHLGCQCVLKRHLGEEKLRDATETGMRYIIEDGKLPPLPNWKNISDI